MRRIFEPFVWAAIGLGRLIDRAAYWLYSSHDRKYREWSQNNRISEEIPDDERT